MHGRHTRKWPWLGPPWRLQSRLGYGHVVRPISSFSRRMGEPVAVVASRGGPRRVSRRSPSFAVRDPWAKERVTPQPTFGLQISDLGVGAVTWCFAMSAAANLSYLALTMNLSSS